MRENSDFKPLKIMKLCLLLSGVKIDHVQRHPVIETIINYILYYLNLVILHTVLFGEAYWIIDGILIGRDFLELSLAAPCTTISILGTLKIIPLYFKSDIVRNIMDTLKEIHPTEDKADDYENVKDTSRKKKKVVNSFNTSHSVEFGGINYHTGLLENSEDFILADTEKPMTINELVSKSIKLLNTVELCLFSMSALAVVMFVLTPSVSMYLEYSKTGEIQIEYPYLVKYWFDVYDIGCWPLAYLHQIWATLIVCFNLMGVETFFYSVCSYIEMHFHILCHRFENIQPGSARRIQEELVVEIKKHQLLIGLVDQMELLYSKPALFQIVSSSLLICLSAFNITVAQEIETTFTFVIFMMLTLWQIFMVSYYGDKLMRSSTELSGAMYKCQWYEFDVNIRKVLLIAIMRAQKPCKLTAANFADLNLRAFTTILSRSWSYFALLKTIYN